MRKAQIVGIDYYRQAACLHGCVRDAFSVKSVLERNGDSSPNFGVRLLTGTGPAAPVNRLELKSAIQDLFCDSCDIALLYFAGHGHIGPTGGSLVTSDARNDIDGDGLSLNEVVTYANQCPSGNRIIILDSCFSGVAGNFADTKTASLTEGLTILTASGTEQYAREGDSGGVFTTLFVDALGGAAANLVGDITPGSVYAHIDQSLGPWAQRPLFKTNVKSFVSLRKVPPSVTLPDLHKITDFFSSPKAEFRLDPSFEPERNSGPDQYLPPPNPTNVDKFAILQKLNRVNLVVPVDAPHMWHAAIGSRSCRLTVLGEHYWRLVNNQLI